jgi:hypothetical protein
MAASSTRAQHAACPIASVGLAATGASPGPSLGPPYNPILRLAAHPLQGLAFVTQRKAGLVAGYNWGSGFAIQRQPDGSWSAPCFLSMRYGSLGLTLGMQTIQSCHLLQVRGLPGGGGGQSCGGE